MSFGGSFQEAESDDELCATTKISRGGPLGAKSEILWTCVRNVLSLIRWKKIRYQQKKLGINMASLFIKFRLNSIENLHNTIVQKYQLFLIYV